MDVADNAEGTVGSNEVDDRTVDALGSVAELTAFHRHPHKHDTPFLNYFERYDHVLDEFVHMMV